MRSVPGKEQARLALRGCDFLSEHLPGELAPKVGRRPAAACNRDIEPLIIMGCYRSAGPDRPDAYFIPSSKKASPSTGVAITNEARSAAPISALIITLSCLLCWFL